MKTIIPRPGIFKRRFLFLKSRRVLTKRRWVLTKFYFKNRENIVQPKGVHDGLVSYRHTYGNGIYLPAAPTSAKFLTCFSSVVVSNRQKQSVSDAFQNVVLPPSSAPTSFEVARRELAVASSFTLSSQISIAIRFSCWHW